MEVIDEDFRGRPSGLPNAWWDRLPGYVLATTRGPPRRFRSGPLPFTLNLPLRLAHLSTSGVPVGGGPIMTPYQRWKADPSPDGPPLSPVLTPAWLGRHRLTGRGNLINAEEWSEIRGLRRAEAMGVKAIARRLGVASNTVRVMHPN